MVEYLSFLISGIFTGVGAGLGTFIANRYFVKRTSKLIESIQSKVNRIPKRFKK
jgi:hypothetical protein